MTDITNVKPGLRELAKTINGELYKEAYGKNRSLSAHLQVEYPLDEQDKKDGYVDSFQRLVQEAGISTSSDNFLGYWADDFEKFYETEQTRALLPEWMSRQWRRVSNPPSRRQGASGQRDLYYSDDQALNTWSRQYFDEPTARWDTQLAPAIPLSELVANTTAIRGDSYRAFYLTSDAAQSRMVRIAEGGEIPRAKLTGSERQVRLHKYGRALEQSYEALRRMRIDMVAMHIQRLAIQAEIDKVATVMDIIVNGDGNANTAATVIDLTTLDPDANAGELTFKGWTRFKMQFPNPYFPTTTLGQEDPVFQLFTLTTGNANMPLMSLPASVVGGLQPINPGLANAQRVGWTSDAPTMKLITFDRRIAIQRITEIGADISEVDNMILNQTKVLTMTEVEGYHIIDPNAAKILDVNA